MKVSLPPVGPSGYPEVLINMYRVGRDGPAPVSCDPRSEYGDDGQDTTPVRPWSAWVRGYEHTPGRRRRKIGEEGRSESPTPAVRHRGGVWHVMGQTGPEKGGRREGTGGNRSRSKWSGARPHPYTRETPGGEDWVRRHRTTFLVSVCGPQCPGWVLPVSPGDPWRRQLRPRRPGDP